MSPTHAHRAFEMMANTHFKGQRETEVHKEHKKVMKVEENIEEPKVCLQGIMMKYYYATQRHTQQIKDASEI